MLPIPGERHRLPDIIHAQTRMESLRGTRIVLVHMVAFCGGLAWVAAADPELLPGWLLHAATVLWPWFTAAFLLTLGLEFGQRARMGKLLRKITDEATTSSAGGNDRLSGAE